jgi:hypothetical protein
MVFPSSTFSGVDELYLALGFEWGLYVSLPRQTPKAGEVKQYRGLLYIRKVMLEVKR